MSDKEHEQNIEGAVKYVLEYRLIRHPVILGSAALFVIALIFFAFGTIKFQSLAIDIDQQGKEALDRSIAHIELVSKNAESSINLAKNTSIQNIKSAEITEIQNFNQEAKPFITQGLESVRLESEKAVNNIKSEGKDAVYSRVRELQVKIDQLHNDLYMAKEKILELNGIKSSITDAKPEISQFLKDWETVKKQGQTWKAALMRSIDNWRKLALELLAFGFISGIVSYVVSKRTRT